MTKWEILPLMVSFRLGMWVVLLSLAIMTPLAWCATRWSRGIIKVLESLLVIPLSLPPMVVGFYLLLCWSPRLGPGSMLHKWGIPLPFTFLGLVIACVIAHGPHLYQSLRTSFAKIDTDLWNASLLLGKGPLTTFFRIILPLSQRGIAAGIITTFLHTVGDFGLVLMIGGSIPGKTRTLSIALYEQVEMMNYSTAHGYAAFLVLMSFIGSVLLNRWAKEV
ncbi:MAG: ABC transporter permease subunit [Treponemataceae bacterium]|nr:ABC transporter permease subunit [Treponemataceae bacterium]